jgi:hypothetical protein
VDLNLRNAKRAWERLAEQDDPRLYNTIESFEAGYLEACRDLATAGEAREQRTDVLDHLADPHLDSDRGRHRLSGSTQPQERR